MKLFPLYIVLFFLFFSKPAFALDTIITDNHHEVWEMRGRYLDYLEDASGTLTLEDILSPEYVNKFNSAKKNEILKNKNIGSTYWLKVTIINNSTLGKEWVVELFDFRIDYVEAFIPDNNGIYKSYPGGAQFPFYDKDYRHKNFVYDVPEKTGQAHTIYFKAKANRPVSFLGIVRTNQRFVEYATSEYFFLALFYGIILAMVLYNLFLFFAVQDLAYFFYVLYVMSIGAYTLSQDGLGFEFVWYNHPSWNDYVFPVSTYSMILWALFYARSFLNAKKYLPLLNHGITLVLILRTLFFVAWMFYPSLAYVGWIDLLILFYVYIAGIISWLSGYRMARFYVLAFTLFFSGFFFTIIKNLGVIADNVYTVYSFNFGVLGEMILLSLALADRIKMLTQEKEKAQHETIKQFQENEALKDKLNQELEEKVQERTRELDAFVYRSSHDIKGPIKSIIGLTSVGLKEVKDSASKTYFEHILKSSQRLDSVVGQLLKILEAKETKLSFTKINFEKLIEEILIGFEGLPSFPLVKIHSDIKQQGEFYSDEKLLYSVLQNMVENALKYRDPEKDESFLKIDINTNAQFAILEFTDNGLGIDKASQSKIFDMFYKANPESSGSGLGLYMTKINIEKLEGSIILNSEEKRGTSFRINIKNHLQEDIVLKKDLAA